jgi:hypothetical protein
MHWQSSPVAPCIEQSHDKCGAQCTIAPASCRRRATCTGDVATKAETQAATHASSERLPYTWLELMRSRAVGIDKR